MSGARTKNLGRGRTDYQRLVVSSYQKRGRLEHVRQELNDRAVFYILKRYIDLAELTGKKTPHSFRATFATLLSSNGVDGLEIQKGGRWRDYDTMSGYVRKGKEFKSEWSKRLGF